jgi:DNA helicase-2/ATP-dependent DNA helicase PcrA
MITPSAAGGPGEGSLPEDPVVAALNPKQGEAVLHGEGPLLVLAGAGSGKTRVLTHRLAYLVRRRSVPPGRIFAVTFTNKAAAEMKQRAERLLGGSAAGLWIGTFHSICLRLLRRHSERVGFPRGIGVSDQDDSVALLAEVLKRRGAGGDKRGARAMHALISAAKNRAWTPDDLRKQSRHPERERQAAAWEEYQSALREQGKADFDDLLLLAARLLEQPEIGPRYADQFLHLLVDEFQDTNRIQLHLVRMLAIGPGGHGNIMAVGDDDQSIYRWRGAEVANILRFADHFPGTRVVTLAQNYRSTGAILELANAVIRHNRGRHPKELWTGNEEGERPAFHLGADEEDEARWVAARVAARRREEVETAWSDFAILYRVHAASRPLEEALFERAIPYVVVGGTAFYQRMEVKDLLAYLRLALNPRDSVSFRRALRAPARGVGATGVERITAHVATTGGDFVAACILHAEELGVRGEARKRLRAFGELLAEVARRADEEPEPLLRLVLERTKYLEWLRGEDKAGADPTGERAEEFEERRANVLELLSGAARFSAVTTEGGLAPYLDQVALYTNLDTSALGDDRVRLMTVHNAKGLEFPHVLLAGLEEGLFPHASSMEDDEELEEERRLFYVGVTRAMRTLSLSASDLRRRMNTASAGGPSRFLAEAAEVLPEAGVGRRLAAPSTWGIGRGDGGWRGGRAGGSTGRPAGAGGWSGGSGRTGRSSGHGTARDAEDEGAVGLPEPTDDELSWSAGGAGDARGTGAGKSGRSGRPRPAKKRLVGRVVTHRIFGEGTVELQDGDGDEARLTVFFPGAGRKKILARFLELPD